MGVNRYFRPARKKDKGFAPPSRMEADRSCRSCRAEQDPYLRVGDGKTRSGPLDARTAGRGIGCKNFGANEADWEVSLVQPPHEEFCPPKKSISICGVPGRLVRCESGDPHDRWLEDPQQHSPLRGGPLPLLRLRIGRNRALRRAQQLLEIVGQRREGDRAGEIFLRQLAHFALVIRQWFWVCHICAPPSSSPF